ITYGSQSSAPDPSAWHLRQARWLRDERNRQRAVPANPGPCGEMVGPRVGSAEWQARQLSSRWQETQVRMFRRAWTEWLSGRGLAITTPTASRAQPGGWNCLTPVPVPNGLWGWRPRCPPEGSADTPVRWWHPTQNVCRRLQDEQSGTLRRASTTCNDTESAGWMSGVRTTPPWQSTHSFRRWQERQYFSSRHAWAWSRRKVGPCASKPRKEPEGCSRPAPPAAWVAAVASCTRSRPSGSVRWHALQRAVACLPS